MKNFPLKVAKRLENRKENNAFRKLGKRKGEIDFSSNDYLGFAVSEEIWNSTSEIIKQHGLFHNGSSGSRLLTGNHELFSLTEEAIADFHHVRRGLDL